MSMNIKDTAKTQGHTTAVVIEALRAACEYDGSQRNWAIGAGFSESYVSDVLRGRRAVSDNLAKALGFRRHSVWRMMY